MPKFRLPRFRAKRLNSSSQECTTIHVRSNEFELFVCVGDTDSFALSQSEEDYFPPLREVVHAPMLDTEIACNYSDNSLMPPAALMLYACLRCPESEVANYSLYIAPQVVREEIVDAPEKKENDPIKAEFLEAHPDIEKFVQGKFKLVELDPFALKFDPQRKTPKAKESTDDEPNFHGLYYVRLLLIIGDDERAENLEFPDTEVMDLTDDSPTGFPAYLKLWVSTQESSSSDKALRKDTEKDLILFEAMPEQVIEDSSDSSRDVLEELGKLDDDDYDQIEG